MFVTNDMTSLKGQVWPGMGKMDLANEEMKRIRNQRKPKSVVDNMRRTSEGIEPTQVVMTSHFDVERIKGVYDDDSPVSDQDEQVRISLLEFDRVALTYKQFPPRKAARSKRKKTVPLAEISANIPRGPEKVGHHVSSSMKPPKSKHRFAPDASDITTPLGPLRSTNDIFCDDESKGGMWYPCWPTTAYLTCEGAFEGGDFAAQSERDQRQENTSLQRRGTKN